MNDQEMLREIHTALVGNEALGHKGLVKRIEETERDVANLKKFRDNLKAKVFAVATGCGGLASGAVEGIKTLLHR